MLKRIAILLFALVGTASLVACDRGIDEGEGGLYDQQQRDQQNGGAMQPDGGGMGQEGTTGQ